MWHKRNLFLTLCEKSGLTETFCGPTLSRHRDRKVTQSPSQTWGCNVKSPSTRDLSFSVSLALSLNFLIPLSATPPPQQSLFLLLTISHSFSHHLSLMPFILHGRSLLLLLISNLLLTSLLFPSFPQLIYLFPSLLPFLLPLWVTGKAAAAVFPRPRKWFFCLFFHPPVCLYHLTRQRLL